MGRHRLRHGYVTAFSGDLADPTPDTDQPDLDLLRRVLDGLRRL